MKFFGKDISIGKLEIDDESTSADSPEMLKRLDRISANYERLDEVLTTLESKMAADERLAARKKKKSTSIEGTPVEEADQALSANPKKPR